MNGLKRSTRMIAGMYVFIVMAFFWSTCISFAATDQSASNTSVSGQTPALPVFKNMSGPQK